MPDRYQKRGNDTHDPASNFLFGPEPVKLSHIRDVLAVAEHGGLRAAGRKLGIAQPALTRSLRELEAELDAALFERHARGVRLTPIGEAFVRRASAMHAELARARDEVEQLKGNDVGRICVAMSTGSGISLLPGVLRAFARRAPDAVVQLTESFFAPIQEELLSGAIDFYVGPFDASSATPRFVSEKLFDNHGLVFARRGHPLAGARALSELANASWVRPALSGRHADADFELMFEAAGLPRPRVALDARSALMTFLAVANSDMLTVLPRQWSDFDIAAGLVQALDVQDRMLRAPICIVRRQDLPLTPLAQRFCDLVRRAAENYVLRASGAAA